jgi:hypothetical protein
MTLGTALWRADIDALQFLPLSHEANCMVHRLAFRRLLDTMPDAQACLEYFDLHAAAFQRAATLKATELRLTTGRSFHLNSRDLRRQLPDTAGRRPRSPAKQPEKVG